LRNSDEILIISQFEDLKNYAESGKLEEVPKLERSVAVFNGLSQWIQCVVLR
jgi:RAS guanyl-releasing protein 3